SLAVPGFDVRFSALQQVNTPHPLSVPVLNQAEVLGTANFPGCNGNTRVMHVGAGVPGATESQGPRTFFSPPLFNGGLTTTAVVAASQLWQKGTIAGDTRASAVSIDLATGQGNLQGGAGPAAGGQMQGLKSMLTNGYAFQENLAFAACGVQSDVT